MKLSAAIRIGSMTTKQIVGAFNNADNGRCALGAALDAVNAEFKTQDQICRGDSNFNTVFALFPVSLLSAKHPIHESVYPVYHIVYGLNDHSGWSRERIADWVETIEAQEEAKNAEKHNEVIENKVEVTA